MREIEVGDLVFGTVYGTSYFMVVQEIDPPYFLGNFEPTQDEAECNASGRTLHWGALEFKDARKIHRLKDLPPAEKICTCTTLDLFRAGCSCGAITPYKQVY